MYTYATTAINIQMVFGYMDCASPLHFLNSFVTGVEPNKNKYNHNALH